MRLHILCFALEWSFIAQAGQSMRQYCNSNWKSKRQSAGQREEAKRRGFSKWLLRRQRPRCLGPDSSLYIRWPSYLPHPQARHPIPSRQGNFLLLTTQPSSIYSSIHLSFFPANWNNNTKHHNNQRLAMPAFFQTLHPISAFLARWVFWSDLLTQSQWEKEICLNNAKNVTGRFWCGLAILSASKYHTVPAKSWDTCH